jgi:hypothetical protein
MLTENKMKNEHSDSRREFVKKAAYVVPAILTLQAAPAYVKAASLNSVIRERVQDRLDQFRDRVEDRLERVRERRNG